MANSNWRDFFDRRYQSSLSSILIEINALSLVILWKGKKIGEEERETKDQELALLKDTDLDIAPYFWKYDGRPTEMLLREYESDLREEGNHSLYRMIQDFRHLYRESKILFQFLKHVRNVAVHDMDDQDTSWCLVVPATVFRVLNISQNIKKLSNSKAGKVSPVAEMESLCIDQIEESIQLEHNHRPLEVSETKLSKNPLEDATGLSSIKAELQILVQQLSETHGVGRDKKRKTLKVQAPEKQLFSLEQAEVKLLQLRKESNEYFKEDEDWPGPGASFLQRALILDALRYEATNWNNWVNTPEGRVRYHKNARWMEKEKTIFWDKAQSILDATRWEEDEEEQ